MPGKSRAGEIGRLPNIEVDVQHQEIRVTCAALACPAPLEFLCVVNGGNEHESVLRTPAKPSDLHAALLMLGLTPGAAVKYSPAAKTWLPPHGPPLSIEVEFEKNGRRVRLPANRLMRDVKTKQEMPRQSWIFVGSRIMPDGAYAADLTSYVVSIVNFELTPIDVPQLASSANETLEWEADLGKLPPLGAPVTMIIQPLSATTQPANISSVVSITPTSLPADPIDALKQRWQTEVQPQADAVRKAAAAQYQIILELRKEQQQLIDRADQIQRVIDDLEHQYQKMTLPAAVETTTTEPAGFSP